MSGQIQTPAALHPRIQSLAHTGGWLGPRVILDTMEKKKISCFCRELDPSSSVAQPVALWLNRMKENVVNVNEISGGKERRAK
jgi:hypothetical protein